MAGNGFARCFRRFLHQKSISKPDTRFQTAEGENSFVDTRVLPVKSQVQMESFLENHILRRILLEVVTNRERGSISSTTKQ